MARLVVSTQSLLVLASDRNIYSVLGHYPHQINGKNILAVTGKRSDPCMLQIAIQGMQGNKMQLILYDSNGGERSLIVCCIPFYEAGAFVGCQLNLRPSAAITLYDALADSVQARVLLSAQAPHDIHMANESFFRHFACSRSEVLGRPVDIVRGFTNYFDDTIAAQIQTDFEAVWPAFLCAAIDGCVVKWPSMASDSCASLYGITCAPVVDAPNGPIRHLLLTFDASSCAEGEKIPCLDESLKTNAGHTAQLHAAKITGCSCEPTQPITVKDIPGQSARAHKRSLTAVIFPRRQPRPDGSLAQDDGPRTRAPPVVVTPGLVSALADLPLRKAAIAVGISVTAFKKACRKLGIRRWAYKRGRPADYAAHAADACADNRADPDEEVGICEADLDDDGNRADGAVPPTMPEPDDICCAAGRDDPWAALWAGDAAAAAALVGMAAAAGAEAGLERSASEMPRVGALHRDTQGLSWRLQA